MLCTKAPVWKELWQPRSFTGLMSIYERNHRLLMRLLQGGVPGEGITLASRSVHDLPLSLTCLERRRYTTTLKLTYWFDCEDGSVPDPDLVVRVYHDAHLAEAMTCRHDHKYRWLRQFTTDHGGELQRRWMMNLMLDKWLDYCLERGHGFRV